jgi:L-2-hydroxyglutarate oxidase LhgO
VRAERCGKLIVATTLQEAERLNAIKAQAEANGVQGMRMLDVGEARALEPELACVGALLSPQTGIVDSHAYMLSMQADAEAHGALFAFNSPVVSGQIGWRSIGVNVGGDDPIALRAKTFVNATGLDAPFLARRIEGIPQETIPTAYYAKGHYFMLDGRTPFARLIYPVPVAGGLGVHLTLDLGGRARFGPDVEWVDRIDYNFDPSRAASFYEAIRRYWPGLRDGALLPGYCGIRPKIVPKGAPPQDFVIQGKRVHGIDGLINLYGIESPGLTAAMALSDVVADMVRAA